MLETGVAAYHTGRGETILPRRRRPDDDRRDRSNVKPDCRGSRELGENTTAKPVSVN